MAHLVEQFVPVVKDHLKKNGQSIIWLSEHLSITYRQLLNIFNLDSPPSIETVSETQKALGIKFLNNAKDAS